MKKDLSDKEKKAAKTETNSVKEAGVQCEKQNNKNNSCSWKAQQKWTQKLSQQNHQQKKALLLLFFFAFVLIPYLFLFTFCI